MVLEASEQFRTGRKAAEKRIFELVNSKIDDLIETADYDWYLPPNTCPRGKESRGSGILTALSQAGVQREDGAEQLHPGADRVPVQHHELGPARPADRDQGADLL